MAQKTRATQPKATPLSKHSYTAAIVLTILITVGIELIVAVSLSQILAMISG